MSHFCSKMHSIYELIYIIICQIECDESKEMNDTKVHYKLILRNFLEVIALSLKFSYKKIDIKTFCLLILPIFWIYDKQTEFLILENLPCCQIDFLNPVIKSSLIQNVLITPVLEKINLIRAYLRILLITLSTIFIIKIKFTILLIYFDYN
ncbi:hypothetical protein MXB_940 [Myxobolus squamalis]|nr:hypothetical protein MXB_940 [Myxobolus squamalis]